MHDKQDRIIYVGKAKALKNRVSQYFRSIEKHHGKVRRMVEHVYDFETIVTDSEFEALVLECSLIKQYMPKYNILLKDSKGYHYIRISPPPFSRIAEARQLGNDGARYLGPYVSSMAVQQSVDEVNRIFQLPTCNRAFPRDIGRDRPCLNFYIQQCCAPCSGRLSREEYDERLEQALEFLTKGGRDAEKLLTERMEAAAERLEFEKAARYRDRITAIRRISQKQKVVMSRIEEQDIIALAQGAGGVCFEIFRFEKGRLHDREHFLLEEIDTPAAARTEFIQRYYSLREAIPRDYGGRGAGGQRAAGAVARRKGREAGAHRPSPAGGTGPAGGDVPQQRGGAHRARGRHGGPGRGGAG